MRRIAIIIVTIMLAAACLLTAPQNSVAQEQMPPTVTGDPIPGLKGYGVELGLAPGSGNILELLVYRGQKLWQALKVCTPEAVPRESPVGTMETADYNFDGYYDLALETAFKQGNASYCIWLYNPKTRRFVASQQLSQLTNTRPDPKTKTVISYSKGECGPCYRQETYRWSKGQLIPVREESVAPADLGLQLPGGCGWLRTVREEKNGKMEFVSRSQVNGLGQDCLPGQP
ncbi:MAG: XAC2610-related protein [Candidatus Korobacteraceae bacterium]